MQTSITIARHPLPIREHRGQRVVSLKDVATLHGVSYNTVYNNFRRNRKRFIPDEDFFNVKDQVTHDKLSRVNRTISLHVFTETGYLMLVKSLKDDTSWAVQRELVNRYFKTQSAVAAKPEIDMAALRELLPLPVQKLLFYRTERQLTQSETAAILGVKKWDVQRVERGLAKVGFHISSQVGTRHWEANHNQLLINFAGERAS